MATLAELERRNRQLMAKLENQRDLLEIEKKRNDLIKKNKSMMREIKYGGLTRFGSSQWKKIRGSGLKAGKNLHGLLLRIEQNRRMNEARAMKMRRTPLRKVKRTIVKRRKLRR